MREGQLTEDDMLANSDMTPAFENFLGLLGGRVRLNGYQGFRGGLDIVNGRTGLESVATQ